MLLERQDEFSLVSAALRRAHAGSGSQLVISGPLGNGKSALLRALPRLEAVGGTRVLRANASSLEQDFAFGVVRQLLDPVLSSAAPEVRERWLDGVAGLARVVFEDNSPPGTDPPASVAAEAVMQGLIAVIRNMSADQPLLILIDDLQWVDEPSLRWFAALAKRLDTVRVLMVATMREGDPRSDSPLVVEVNRFAARRLRPDSLSLAATAELVRRHTGEAPDEAFARVCHETTAGNPMFLMSALITITHAGVSPTARNLDIVRTLRPAQLRQRLIQCLRTQSGSVRAFASAAVTLGTHADVELIGRLAGLDTVGCGSAMRTLYRLGVLKDERKPHFTHLVVQDAVEESMTVEERQDLHVRAVKLLHGSGHSAEQVAAQLMAITTHHDGWAIEVLRAGADTAMRRGAPEVAARYLRRALLDASPDGEDRARVLVDLAMAERGFDSAAAVRHISYAVPLFRSVRDRAAAVVRIAPTVLVGASKPVRDLIWKVTEEIGCLETLTGIDRELALRLEARLRYTGHADPAELGDSVRRLTRLGIDELVDTGAGRELLIVLLHAAMMTAAVPAGEIARLGERILEHEPASPTHVHTMLPLLVTTMVAADSVSTLVPWLDSALERARLQDVTIERALIRTEQAMVMLHFGRTADARIAAYDAVDLAALEWRGPNVTAAVGLAAVAMELREPQLVARLVGLDQERTESAGVAAVCRMLHGAAAALNGDFQRALEFYLDCGHTLDRVGWRNPVIFPWRLAAAMMNARLGDLDAALELAEEARTRAVDWGAPSGVGRALRILGRLTPGSAGVDLLDEAVSVLDGSGNTVELAKALLELGTRKRADGDPTATDLLRRAQELALRAGADRLVERSGAELEGTPDHQAPVSRPRLTKSESKVVELAVAGHTNQEISEILEVTCRAVEKHLTNSFRKLGVRRRTELAEVLPGRGSGIQ